MTTTETAPGKFAVFFFTFRSGAYDEKRRVATIDGYGDDPIVCRVLFKQ
jgi:hypothetical protein